MLRKIDIVSVSFNSRKYIEKYIESLYKTADIDFNLFIYDNASTDGTVELLKEFEHRHKNLKVVYADKNINFGPANNYLVKNYCSAELILFLNIDLIFYENWLVNLINGLYETDADVAGAKLIYPYNKTIQHCGIEFDIGGMPHHIYRFAPSDLPHTNKRKEFPNVTAACLLMKCQDFIDVDGFDEKYINGYEDNDLCMKLRMNGKKIIVEPQTVIEHYESVSPGISDYNLFSGKYFFDKWKDITLEIGKRNLDCVAENSTISIFGAGEKCKQLLDVLKLYNYKIDNIYDRQRKKVDFWDKSIRDIDDLKRDSPRYLIIASIYQYNIIRELKQILDNINYIPICKIDV